MLAEVWERVDREGESLECVDVVDRCGDLVCDTAMGSFQDCARSVRDGGPLVYCLYEEEILTHPWRLLR